MEPIPRPEGYVDPPKPETARPVAPPAPDPNKVTLRWKLAVNSPVAFRLEGSPAGGNGKDNSGQPMRATYVLQRPEAGDSIVRVATEGVAAPDQGTFSDRGFMLDGLGGVDRNTATLWMELPVDPVGVGDKWSLGADLVDMAPLGAGFSPKKEERRNSAKLAAISPEGDDRVATIEYDLYERVSGMYQEHSGSSHDGHSHDAKPPEPPKAAANNKKGGKKGAAAEEPTPAGPKEVIAEVTFTGRGEFLVKAGRWRSWEGTLTSRTEGYTPKTPDKAVAQVPAGSYKVKLTALDSVPAELQPEAKK
jgi:hypothetical protein